MSPNAKRSAGSGNSHRTYDEAAPSESITSSLQRAVPGLNAERIRRRARLREDEERRAASRELNELIERMNARPLTDEQALARSEAINRRTANDLAANGFDVAYLARRFGLPTKQQATAPERTSAAA